MKKDFLNLIILQDFNKLYSLIILTTSNKMRAIQEQRSIEAQSIALDQQSQIRQNSSEVIQQYGNLDFSDEQSEGRQIQNSSQQGQLSADKLKFLGVDKFPGPYAQKVKDVSQTRSNFSQSINKKNEILAQTNGYYSRKRMRQQKQLRNSFNIDSFLNSRPSNDHKNKIRQKHNTTGFGKQLYVQDNKKMKRIGIFESEPYQKQDLMEKRIENDLRNKKVRNFISNYGKNKNNEYSLRYSNTDESISLITLPEPPEIVNKQQGKSKHLKDLCKCTTDELKMVQANRNFNIRFEQAKINFLDSFLPESLRIGSNPYNFLKYTKSRNHHLHRII